MIQKLKTILLSFSLLFVLGAPVAVTATAFADTATPQNSLCGGATSLTIDSSNTCSNTTGTGSTVNSDIAKIINLLSVIVGIVAVVMIIVGGFRYITSGGKQESITGAKNTILYAVIGLVVVALAQIIVRFVLDKTTQAT